MIPVAHITHWRGKAPWPADAQIEQDLILTKAVIQIYSDPLLTEAFAFRGGTAMQKLFFEEPTRYSEDIDLVQVRAEPIGAAIDALRKHLDPWLGKPSRDTKKDRVTLIYRFDSEIAPIKRMRLKVEVNTGEHFTVLGTKRLPLTCDSEWFRGSADILTYEVEELLGTKMRALYQRKKGRDLYDLAMALKHFSKLDLPKTIKCFEHYMNHGKTPVSRAQFEANFANKLKDPGFIADIQPLLAPHAPTYDAVAEAEAVKSAFLARLQGDPWKDPAKKNSDRRKA